MDAITRQRERPYSRATVGHNVKTGNGMPTFNADIAFGKVEVRHKKKEKSEDMKTLYSMLDYKVFIFQAIMKLY